MLVKIVIAIIILHLIVGFGWLMWKLSSGNEDLIDSSEEVENKIGD